MGDLPASATIHNADISATLRHLPVLGRELLRTVPVHILLDRAQILKEIQKDGV